MPQRRRITGHEKRIVGARANWTCEVSGELLDEAWEADHVVPLHQGGADHVDNLQACCHACHRKKTVREEAERLRRAHESRASRAGRPPLECMRCEQIVSPYFSHRCPPLEGDGPRPRR